MVSEVETRLATVEDAAAIAKVLFDAFSQYRSCYTPEAFAVVTPNAAEIIGRFNEGPIWVAVTKGGIVGTVSGVPEPEWLYIRSMAVSPSTQGMGIGHRLIDAIEEYGIENGYDRLFLYTTYFSIGAIELYEKHGFKRGRDTTADEWYGTPGLAMDKEIGKGNTRNAAGS